MRLLGGDCEDLEDLFISDATTLGDILDLFKEFEISDLEDLWDAKTLGNSGVFCFFKSTLDADNLLGVEFTSEFDEVFGDFEELKDSDNLEEGEVLGVFSLSCGVNVDFGDFGDLFLPGGFDNLLGDCEALDALDNLVVDVLGFFGDTDTLGDFVITVDFDNLFGDLETFDPSDNLEEGEDLGNCATCFGDPALNDFGVLCGLDKFLGD